MSTKLAMREKSKNNKWMNERVSRTGLNAIGIYENIQLTSGLNLLPFALLWKINWIMMCCTVTLCIPISQFHTRSKTSRLSKYILDNHETCLIFKSVETFHVFLFAVVFISLRSFVQCIFFTAVLVQQTVHSKWLNQPQLKRFFWLWLLLQHPRHIE